MSEVLRPKNTSTQTEYAIVHNDGRVQFLGANGLHHAEQYKGTAKIFLVTTHWTEVEPV